MKVLTLLLVLTTTIPFAYGQTNLDIANQYFEAYQALDFEKMSQYYTDSAEFVDLTYRLVNKEVFYVKGKDKIRNVLTAGFAPTLAWNMDFHIQFKSGEFVVVAGMIRSATRGDAWGRPDKPRIELHHPFVTILAFDDLKIIEHRDYFDYETAGKQLYGDQRSK